MNSEETNKETVFTIAQKFLKDPPLIVWGSGATIPFGYPSMRDLFDIVSNKFDNFNDPDKNLETELGKPEHQETLDEIRQLIWDSINIADTENLRKITNGNVAEFNGLKVLIEKLFSVHPQTINIVTTNYDRVLEYVLSYYNFPYTDGFNGKTLSKFDDSLFEKKKTINILKVHGSMNWFDIDDETRFLSTNVNNDTPKIIAPGASKYQETIKSPFRELIQKSDHYIDRASSILVIGFGFNDEHLTPKVKVSVRRGTPIILITKHIHDSVYRELNRAQKYIYFEEHSEERTKVIFKENSTSQEKELIINGSYWQLNNFMEILE